MPEQHEPGGCAARNLPAEFTADRAPRTRDHHRLPFGDTADTPGIGDHRRPAQQILDLHRAQLIHAHAARQNLGHRRHCAGLHVRVRTDAHDFAHHGPRRIADGENHHADVTVGQMRLELRYRSQHAHAADDATALRAVVVEIAHRHETEMRAVEHFTRRHAPRVAGAENEHALALRGHAPPSTVAAREARGESRHREPHDRPHRLRRDHGQRQSRMRQSEHRQDEGRQRNIGQRRHRHGNE